MFAYHKMYMAIEYGTQICLLLDRWYVHVCPQPLLVINRCHDFMYAYHKMYMIIEYGVPTGLLTLYKTPNFDCPKLKEFHKI